MFRYLNKNEIQVRVQKNTDTYATLVLYKDARVDINILNEVFGVGFWQKKYEMVGKYLTAIVLIYNKELKEWIQLQDVGTESNFQPEKGLFSDAFKRACFNLGIGIELYTAPKISIKLNTNDFGKDKKLKTTFSIKDYEVKDGIITKLSILDNNNIERFSNIIKENKTADTTIDDTAINEYYEYKDCTMFKDGEYAGKYLHTLSTDNLNKITVKLKEKSKTADDKTKEKINKYLSNITIILMKRGELSKK